MPKIELGNPVKPDTRHGILEIPNDFHPDIGKSASVVKNGIRVAVPIGVLHD
jgi:hypothetical protein